MADDWAEYRRRVMQELTDLNRKMEKIQTEELPAIRVELSQLTRIQQDIKDVDGKVDACEEALTGMAPLQRLVTRVEGLRETPDLFDKVHKRLDSAERSRDQIEAAAQTYAETLKAKSDAALAAAQANWTAQNTEVLKSLEKIGTRLTTLENLKQQAVGASKLASFLWGLVGAAVVAGLYNAFLKISGGGSPPLP